MANNQWQFINTLINLGTFSRVGDVTAAQERLNAHLIGKEIQNQHDNTLLSQLVDIYVKVGELTRDERFFDALISSGIGLAVYYDSYPRIVDATTKMKAAELSMKLKSGIEETLGDLRTSDTIAKILSDFMVELDGEIENAIRQLNSIDYKFRWLGLAPERKVAVGEELFAVENAYHQNSQTLLFQEGKPYEVMQYDNAYRDGVVLNCEIGKNFVIFRGRNGGYDRFGIFAPSLPNLRVKLSAWEAARRVFDEEFISANIKKSRERLIEIRQKAETIVGKTFKHIEERINAYHSNRNVLIQKKLPEAKVDQSPRGKLFDKWLFAALVVIAVYLVLSNLKC